MLDQLLNFFEPLNTLAPVGRNLASDLLTSTSHTSKWHARLKLQPFSIRQPTSMSQSQTQTKSSGAVLGSRRAYGMIFLPSHIP